MKETFKGALGYVASAVDPQCRFDRTVFILAHMRCGSTALANILCSRPEISGYGEAHIAYRNEADLGRLVVNQIRRKAWSPRARYLFDKVLHNRHDRSASGRFFTSRAIFLCREPAQAIPSIRRLYASLGRDEYTTDVSAAEYYAERVERMAVLWRAFPQGHACGFTHASLTSDPEAALNRISEVLGLTPPLENSYRSHAASTRGGGGDPTASSKLNKIMPARPSDADLSALELDDALRTRVSDAYGRFVDLLDTPMPDPDAGPMRR